MWFEARNKTTEVKGRRKIRDTICKSLKLRDIHGVPWFVKAYIWQLWGLHTWMGQSAIPMLAKKPPMK